MSDNDEDKSTDLTLKKSTSIIFDDRGSCRALTNKNTSCRSKIFKNDYCKRHYNLYRLERPTDCVVCTESLAEEERPLSCGHWVHRKCIVSWGKDICPMCRKRITLSASEHRQIERRQGQQQMEMIMNFLMNMLFTIESQVEDPEIHLDPEDERETTSEDSSYSEDDSEDSKITWSDENSDTPVSPNTTP